jgi:predicted nucleotidyltransferase component of viral defense system
MKEHIRDIITEAKNVAEATLLVREYLQARILEALQRGGAFEHWAFLGGTALRFLYRLPRFSEDLDFSRTTPSPPGVSLRTEFDSYVTKVKRAFESEAYDVDVRSRPDAVVQSAFVGFPGLLYELGLSSQAGQKITIKIEIDSNPPAHASTETSLIRRHILLNLLHYDKSSLFAGKLHALIHRSHVKGRDVYDLVWYLSDPSWPEPNLPLLQASLAQTGIELTDQQISAWRSLVVDRIAAMEWNRVVADVSPFLERTEDVGMLTRENVLGLLKGSTSR